MINVSVKGIAYDQNNTPIILLADSNEEKVLPIWVGMLEAQSIALALENQQTPRPLTHDLMLNLCNNLEVSLSKVIISDLKDNTFFAELHLLRESENIQLDARPSDAIALALRTGIPIFLNDKLIEQMLKIEELIQEDSEEGVEEVENEVIKDYKKNLH